MKIGSLVYATHQGLGILAKDFYDHGVITDPLVIGHSSHPNQLQWYPSAPVAPIGQIMRPPHYHRIREFVQGMDVMLFFETPFDWSLIEFCRLHNVKTIIMPMHECMPKYLPLTNRPDYWLCPSLLDLRWVAELYGIKDLGPDVREIQNAVYGAKFLPVPVPDNVRWRQRTKVETFVHNAGNGSFRDRNGTGLLIDAFPYLKSPAKILIRSQKREAPTMERLTRHFTKRSGGADCGITYGTIPFENLYAHGDAFIFCEKWNGLCLPLQEARASGMLVIAGDRFPVNTWLPRLAEYPATEPALRGIGIYGGVALLPPKETVRGRISHAYQEFDEAIYDPRQLAELIDFWYGKDVTTYSLQGKEWAEKNSWNVLGPQYKTVLEQVCAG